MIKNPIIIKNPTQLIELQNLIIRAFREKNILVEILNISLQNNHLDLSLKFFAFKRFRNSIKKALAFKRLLSSYSNNKSSNSLKSIRGKKHFKKKTLSLKIKKNLVYPKFTFYGFKKGKFKKFRKAYTRNSSMVGSCFLNLSKEFKIKNFLLDIIKKFKKSTPFSETFFTFEIINTHTLLNNNLKMNADMLKSLQLFADLTQKNHSRFFSRKLRHLGKDFQILGVLIAYKFISPAILLECITYLFLPLYKRRHNYFYKFLQDYFNLICKIDDTLVLGVFFRVNGKLAGKSMASVKRIAVADIASKPISQIYKKSGTNKIGTFGFQLVINYQNFPCVPVEFLWPRIEIFDSSDPKFYSKSRFDSRARLYLKELLTFKQNKFLRQGYSRLVFTNPNINFNCGGPGRTIRMRRLNLPKINSFNAVAYRFWDEEDVEIALVSFMRLRISANYYRYKPIYQIKRLNKKLAEIFNISTAYAVHDL